MNIRPDNAVDPRKGDRWAFVWMLVIVAVVAFVRMRLLTVPLERDEGEYAYAGQLILQGIPPYELAYNMKLPGTYAGYAVIMAIFGQTPAGIHLGILCLTTLTGIVLYFAGAKLLDKKTGACAAATYLILAALPAMNGLAGHATHFAAFFASLGFWLLWPGENKFNSARVFLGGVIFGLALLAKQHAVFFPFLGLIFLAVSLLRSVAVEVKTRLQILGSYCLGVALPYAITVLVLWRAGVLKQFWFWTFSYAREYVATVSSGMASKLFVEQVGRVLGGAPLLWALALVGCGFVLFDATLRKIRFQLLGFLVASILTIFPGLVFRGHYFLLMLPAIALAAGAAVSSFAFRLKERQRAWPGLAFSLITLVSFFENRIVWFAATPTQAAQVLYFDNPFSEAERVAAFIRAHSPPNAKVAVVGSEPEIYFLSHRHSATGYIYMYPLVENQPFASRMQAEMIREIETARPEILVFVSVRFSWLPRTGSDRTVFHWFDNYETNYDLVHFEPLRASSDPEAGLMVYQRKAESQPAQ